MAAEELSGIIHVILLFFFFFFFWPFFFFLRKGVRIKRGFSFQGNEFLF